MTGGIFESSDIIKSKKEKKKTKINRICTIIYILVIFRLFFREIVISTWSS